MCLDLYALSHLRPTKKSKLNPVPIVFADVNTTKGSGPLQTIKVLLDSGASKTIIQKDVVKALNIQKNKETLCFSTPGGALSPRGTAKFSFV